MISSKLLINVSQGFWTYEPNPANELRDFADTLAELKKSGCIMVKAAGNDAFERNPTTFAIADAILHVEAASVSRSLSKFSSNGEVRAPGSLIASINPMGAGSESCQNMRYPAIISSGTSFATPIVTGILAHVRAHLKKNSAFLQLAPEQHINVLQNIMKASEIGDMVNGYRAVVMAKLWRPELQTIENMRDALTSNCPAPPTTPTCANTTDASSYLNCMAPVRRSLALCPQSLAKESIETFLDGLLSHNAADLWLSYAGVIKQNDTLQSTAVRAGKLLAAAMPAQLVSNNNNSWLEGLDVISATNHLIATRSMNPDFLYRYSQSAALLDALNKSNGRDGRLRDRLKVQLAALVQLDANVLFSSYEKAYFDWNQLIARDYKFSKFFPLLVDSMGRIRLQNFMRSIAPEDKLSMLDKIESHFLQKIQNEYNETPYPISGPKPSLSSVTEENTIETWDGPELSAFYQKHGLAINIEGPPAQLLSMPASFVASELAAERRAIVDSKAYPKLSLFVIRGLSKLSLWTKFRNIQDRMLQAAIMNLQLAVNISQDREASLKSDFKAIVDAANHVSFKFALLDRSHFGVGTGYTYNPDGTRDDYPVSSLVDTEMRRKILLQIFSELPLQTPDNIADNAQFFSSVLNSNKDLLPKTTWQSYKAPTEWIFSEWISSYKTRLDKISSEPQIFRNTQGANLPVIFNDALSAYLRAVAKDIQTFIGYRPFMTAQLAKDLQNLDGFCQMSDRSRLIRDVETVLQTINTSPTGQYYQTMKADLEAFKNQCLQVN